MSQSERSCDRTWIVHVSGARRRLPGVVIGGLAVLAMAIANAPYRYLESGSYVVGSPVDPPRWADFDSVQTAVMAGWPFRYSVQYRAVDVELERFSVGNGADPVQGPLETRWWSTPRLLVNGLIAAGAAMGLYFLVQYRERWIRGANRSERARRRLDFGSSIAVVLLPVCILGSHWFLAAKDKRLAQRLANDANCYLACWLPEPIADRVPFGFAKKFARIRHVRFLRPSDEAVRQVAQIPTLVGLELAPGAFDHGQLAPLRSRVHLSAFIAHGGGFSETMMRCIGDCRWLLQLELSQADLDAGELRQLDSLPRLRWVDLTGTSMRLSDLGRPDWSRSVCHLHLPLPPPGRADSLTIDRWPKLTDLTLFDPEHRTNAATLQLRLSRLPRLRRLVLDRAHKIAFFGQDLPQLTELNEPGDVEGRVSRLDADQRLPRALWFSRLSLSRVPSLAHLRCWTRDLAALSIRDCRRLRRLELSAGTIRPDGTTEFESTSAKRCQTWIDELGAREGPSSVTLSGLSLDGVDLSPLKNNRKIRRLNMAHTSLSFEQLESFAASSGLEELVLGQCPVTATDLNWLLEACPSLERLSLDLSKLTRLDIVDNDQLTALIAPPIREAEQVRLVDLPRLETTLRFVTAPQRFEIRNMPQLQGLMIEEPWPTNATIQGVPQLRWLAIGGDSAGDDVLRSLLDCAQLDRLSIAYGSLSKQMLAEVGRFEQLVTLELPGAEIDDSVTRHWQPLENLQHVCLDDTSISAETMAWLSNIESLQSLSINRVHLNAAASERLADCHQLCKLRLRDAVVDQQSLCRLLQMGLLDLLDVSGHPIDEPLFDAIARCTALSTVVMSRQEARPKRVRRLLEGNGYLHVVFVDPGGEPTPIDQLELPAAIKTAMLQRQLNAQPQGVGRSISHRAAELAARGRTGIRRPTPPDPFRGQFTPGQFASESDSSTLMSAAGR